METPSIAARNVGDPSLPVSSLHLLVPPLQLLSAAMWQILQQQAVLHYGKLEEFVSLVMEAFPELLSESQRTELILGLQCMSPAGSASKTDPALEVLLWEFLSRLGQLLPVPDLKQTVSWLTAAPSVLEDCVQSVSYPDKLKTLLRHHRSLGQLEIKSTVPPMSQPPSQRMVDTTKLTDANSQSESTDCRKCLSHSSSGGEMKAESVMSDTDYTGVERRSSLNRCEDVVEQRETGHLVSWEHEDVLTNIKKEEEGWELQGTLIKREDCVEHEVGLWKEEELEMSEQEEGHAAAQTDQLVKSGVKSERGQQEGDEVSSLVSFCLLQQHRMWFPQLELNSDSGPVSSPLSSQLEEPLKLLPSSSENRICAEGSPISSVISPRNRNTGQTVEVSSQAFACSPSPFTDTQEVNLHQHVKKVHFEEFGMTLRTRQPPSSTNQHPTPAKTLPTLTQSNTGAPEVHKCSQCGKTFKSKLLLTTHVEMHKRDCPHQCPQCDDRFRSSHDLKIHQQSHTRERPYHCSLCGKSFIKSDKLSIHQRTHTGERPYRCSSCGKSFAQSCTLKRHQRTHTGERPYRCSQCGYSFTQLSALKQHQRTHTGERPHQCTECGKRFSISSRLKLHMRTHTGERPYRCTHCGKSFARSDYLTIHQRNHTLGPIPRLPLVEELHSFTRCQRTF